MTTAPLKNQTDVTIGMILVFKHNGKTEFRKIREEEAILREPVKIQTGLLPEKNMEIEGIKINWLFHPTDYGSGDLFNFFPLNEHIAGFYLFDVMGHGFSAALFSVILHKFLSPDPEKGGILRKTRDDNSPHPHRRASDLLPNINNPERVLSELNKRFYFEDNSSPFFTIVYGIINTLTGKARVAKAGHLPPLLHHENIITKIDSAGVAIGIQKEIRIEEREFIMGKGDRLYIYSDGLIESTNRYMNRFTNDRLIHFLKTNKNSGLHDLIIDLETAILDWRENRKFDDDVAFMVLERS